MQRATEGGVRGEASVARVAAILSLLAVLFAACGSSGSDKTDTTAPGPTSGAATTATTAKPAGTTATSAAATTTGLSGRWSGQYTQTAPAASGGTFVLTWQQTGNDLSGSITVSGPSPFQSTINGALQGSSIRFGTLSQGAITYTGSVSGNSMSGTYQDSSGIYKGTWSAQRT